MRQLRNRGKRFVRGATGPYANRLRGKVYVNTFGRLAAGNLWTDNPDSVGAGWTDNGDGTYACDNTDGTSVSQSAAIEDGVTYTVSSEITGYIAGSVNIYLGSPSNFGVTANISGNGSNSQDVVVSNPGGASNIISIDSNSFWGVIGNISVVKK